MTGKFIVFEGIDGSGTSTQADLLVQYFRRKGQVCYLTCEPSSGPIGNMIRQGMKGRVIFSKGENPVLEKGDLFDEQMAYLFAADRHDHLYNPVDGVINQVNSGAVVISTRYFFSSFAYHCSSKEDFTLVKTLNSKFPDPDLVIYMDNPVGESIKRMSTRAFADEYENERKLKQVSDNYSKIFSEYEGAFLSLNATNNIDTIHHKIVEKVESLK
ncbi:dTMP kinase [Amphritea sp.]|uniref:dTMP kinase n=1 Tax=Amphritea sp. TaxID=1872502 RepID=UPI003A8FD7DC